MGNLPSGLPDEVADEEDLVRFLTSRSQYSTIIVKPAASCQTLKIRRHLYHGTGVNRQRDSGKSERKQLGNDPYTEPLFLRLVTFALQNLRCSPMNLRRDMQPFDNGHGSRMIRMNRKPNEYYELWSWQAPQVNHS